MQIATTVLPVPEPDLIRRARQGDSGSITWLFEKYQPVLFRYLYYRVGDRQNAEDLTSEVFIRMLRALPGYQWQSVPFQSWLFLIARNLAVDYFRRSGRNEFLSETLQAPDLAPEVALEETLTHDRLRQALSRVKDDQREVIILRFILEMPITEAALMLGKSENAIKGLQRRGLARLRSVLGEEAQESAIR